MTQAKILALAGALEAPRLESICNCETMNRMATLNISLLNLDRAASLPVDAAVLLAAEPEDNAFRMLEELSMRRSRLALVLICRSADATILSRAMQSGVTRVLTLDMGEERLREGILAEIDRVQSRQERAEVREYESRVISVASTKGGSGKTTVAVNLAAALQAAGKKTAMVDLDLQFGDVGVFLNIPRCDTIADMVAEPNLSADTVRSFLYAHGSGLQVLCAPISPELAETVKPEHIEKILSALRPEFDYVVLDLAPTLDDCMLTAMENSDTIYFVTNPEIPTLKNTRACVNVLKTLDQARKLRLVINREDKSYVSRQDVKKALELDPVLCVPFDKKAATAAMNRGIPVVTASPRSAIAKTFRKFVKAGDV